MIHRKENGQLQAKAGLGIIDNILSTLSNHPISNRAVATEFAKINNDLTQYMTLSVTLESNPYVTPFTYYKAVDAGVVVKSIVIRHPSSTAPVIATVNHNDNSTHDIISVYGTLSETYELLIGY